MLEVLPKDNNIINAKKWHIDMISIIKICKRNVLPSYDHHGTTGECFSFGNRPVYKNTNGVTFDVYVNKRSSVVITQQKIGNNLKEVDAHVASLIDGGVDKLKRFLTDTL